MVGPMAIGRADPRAARISAPEAVSEVFPPIQMVVFPEMLGVIVEFTVTITEAVASPQDVPALTTYVVDVVGETVIDVVEAPVDHE